MECKQTASVVFVVCWATVAIPALAAFGKDIIFKSTDRGPANFSFSLPPNDDFILIVIVGPTGQEVCYLTGDGDYGNSSKYENRIINPQFKNGTIMFSLMNVTRKDGGHYSCKRGHQDAPVIPDCGQTLRYIVEDKNASEGTTSLPEKETATGSTPATTDTGHTGSPVEPQTSHTGAITGGVIGGVVLIAIVVIVVIVVWWKRKKAETPASTVELQPTRPEEPDPAPLADDADGANAEVKLLPTPNPTEQKPPEAEENVSGQQEKDDKEAKTNLLSGASSPSDKEQN